MTDKKIKPDEITSGKVTRYSLSDLVKEVDRLEPGELNFNSHPDVRRFKIAGWLFWSCIVLIFFSWLQYLIMPEWLISSCMELSTTTNQALSPTCDIRYERLVTVAENIFEFAKTWIPPLLGLVVGFYFTSKEQNGNTE